MSGLPLGNDYSRSGISISQLPRLHQLGDDFEDGEAAGFNKNPKASISRPQLIGNKNLKIDKFGARPESILGTMDRIISFNTDQGGDNLELPADPGLPTALCLPRMTNIQA